MYWSTASTAFSDIVNRALRPPRGQREYTNILVVCADSAKARYSIRRELRNFKAAYLLDLSNRVADGQVIFGRSCPHTT